MLNQNTQDTNGDLSQVNRLGGDCNEETVKLLSLNERADPMERGEVIHSKELKNMQARSVSPD